MEENGLTLFKDLFGLTQFPNLALQLLDTGAFFLRRAISAACIEFLPAEPNAATYHGHS